jgi:hypothetical protein
MNEETEKIKILVKRAKNVVIDYNGSEIVVQPYLTTENQIILAGNYLADYFDSSSLGKEYNVLLAENGLLLAVIQLCTNIDMSEILSSKDLSDDFLSNTQLCDDIISKIQNYWEFYTRLTTIVDDVRREKEMQLSLGAVIDGLATKVSSLLENLMGFEPTDENMQKIKDMLKTVESSPIMKQLAGNLEDGKKKPAPKKKEKIH